MRIIQIASPIIDWSKSSAYMISTDFKDDGTWDTNNQALEKSIKELKGLVFKDKPLKSQWIVVIDTAKPADVREKLCHHLVEGSGYRIIVNKIDIDPMSWADKGIGTRIKNLYRVSQSS